MNIFCKHIHKFFPPTFRALWMTTLYWWYQIREKCEIIKKKLHKINVAYFFAIKKLKIVERKNLNYIKCTQKTFFEKTFFVIVMQSIWALFCVRKMEKSGMKFIFIASTTCCFLQCYSRFFSPVKKC